MQTAIVLKEIEKYIRDFFFVFRRPYLFYHNLNHTLRVVTHTKEIAEFYKYTELDLFIVLTAAWFHDTGQLQGDTASHEQKSMALMAKFLGELHIDPVIINEVGKCIMATKMPVSPGTLSEKIICDADTYHLGTIDFFEQNNLVKMELEARTGKTIENWHVHSLAFLHAHHYYTTYCQQLLSGGKIKNIQKLMWEE